jgi:hypothetical protein
MKTLDSPRAEELRDNAQRSLDEAGLHYVDVLLRGLRLQRSHDKIVDSAPSDDATRLAVAFLGASQIAALSTQVQAGLLTNSEVHERWMLAAVEILGSEMTAGLPPQRDISLAKSAISAHVPILEGLCAEEVLNIRRHLASEYLAFRTEVRRLSDRITAEPWSKDFALEIESLVRSEIDPRIDELRRALERSGNLFNHLAGDLADMLRLGVPFAGSLLAGAAVEQAGAIGLITGVVGAAMRTRLDTRSAKSSNVMSYVLSLGSEVESRKRGRIGMRING